MNAATELLAGLRAQGIRLRVIEGDRLSVRPWSALDSRTRDKICEEKPRLVALLKETSPEPLRRTPSLDPTPTPAPCAACGGGLFWRQLGQTLLQCQLCAPCPSVGAAAWYHAASPLDPLGELLGAECRTALDWHIRRHPEALRHLLSLQRRCDGLPASASSDEKHAAASALVSLVEGIRDHYREIGGDA